MRKAVMIIIYITLICINANIFFGSPVEANIPSTERDSLIALYNSTGGASWVDRTNWRNVTDTDFNAPGTECSWYGVSCDGTDSTVLEVLLHFNNLTGTTPTGLGDLPNLQKLFLYRNSLTGPIPSELGSLSQLEELKLGNNALLGSLPSELGNLSNLALFLINGNNILGEIPATYMNLTQLNDAQSNFKWNGLFTNDNALRSFLNTKQAGGDWESTQTVPPTNLFITNQTATSLTLNWTPIAYTGNTGWYEVFYAEGVSGPFLLYGSTVDKTVSSMDFSGLDSTIIYYFYIETITQSHINNQQNDIRSVASDMASMPIVPTISFPGLLLLLLLISMLFTVHRGAQLPHSPRK